MELGLLLTFLILAAVGSYAVLSRRAGRIANSTGPEVITSVAVGFMWWITAFGASEVEITKQCCVVYQQYNSLMFFGAAAGIVMFVFAFAAMTGQLTPMSRGEEPI